MCREELSSVGSLALELCSVYDAVLRHLQGQLTEGTYRSRGFTACILETHTRRGLIGAPPRTSNHHSRSVYGLRANRVVIPRQPSHKPPRPRTPKGTSERDLQQIVSSLQSWVLLFLSWCRVTLVERAQAHLLLSLSSPSSREPHSLVSETVNPTELCWTAELLRVVVDTPFYKGLRLQHHELRQRFKIEDLHTYSILQLLALFWTGLICIRLLSKRKQCNTSTYQREQQR
ncbi:hypothetical protein L211DRAFT_363636 [Terfezia boudieri ATCC MYA-4762]|uniref:Uncharacterized protein n=1 Tax=Terfezia boudieri ATCC MYA-4762 TaxID=1051890 RepID=A0A3N4MHS3_9PEZI|nr:hypothetical protein L211DRAFT_363636 [Terfezia boudieri ATCC MYA-4762]